MKGGREGRREGRREEGKERMNEGRVEGREEGKGLSALYKNCTYCFFFPLGCLAPQSAAYCGSFFC